MEVVPTEACWVEADHMDRWRWRRRSSWTGDEVARGLPAWASGVLHPPGSLLRTHLFGRLFQLVLPRKLKSFVLYTGEKNARPSWWRQLGSWDGSRDHGRQRSWCSAMIISKFSSLFISIQFVSAVSSKRAHSSLSGITPTIPKHNWQFTWASHTWTLPFYAHKIRIPDAYYMRERHKRLLHKYCLYISFKLAVQGRNTKANHINYDTVQATTTKSLPISFT